MERCEFTNTSPDTYEVWRYVVRGSDVEGAANGRAVLERACVRIFAGRLDENEAKPMWPRLAAANKHVLEFVVVDETKCYPAMLPENKTPLQVPQTLHVGKVLWVPEGWPTGSLEAVVPSLAELSQKLDPVMERAKQQLNDDTDDGTEDTDASPWLILGAIGLAVAGTWWMATRDR